MCPAGPRWHNPAARPSLARRGQIPSWGPSWGPASALALPWRGQNAGRPGQDGRGSSARSGFAPRVSAPLGVMGPQDGEDVDEAAEVSSGWGVPQILRQQQNTHGVSAPEAGLPLHPGFLGRGRSATTDAGPAGPGGEQARPPGQPASPRKPATSLLVPTTWLEKKGKLRGRPAQKRGRRKNEAASADSASAVSTEQGASPAPVSERSRSAAGPDRAFPWTALTATHTSYPSPPRPTLWAI